MYEKEIMPYVFSNIIGTNQTKKMEKYKKATAICTKSGPLNKLT